jgi:hypothetical protein
MPPKRSTAGKELTAAEAFRLKAQDLIVVLWSESRQDFDFVYLGRAIQEGLVLYQSRLRPLGWVPVALASSLAQAKQKAKALMVERRFRKPNRVIH